MLLQTRLKNLSDILDQDSFDPKEITIACDRIMEALANNSEEIDPSIFDVFDNSEKRKILIGSFIAFIKLGLSARNVF